MKKTLCLVLSMLMLLGTLCGCSLFTSGNESGNAGSTGDIKMTEKYSFKDPKDLEFAKRYALYCDENSPTVASASAFGVLSMYAVLYADAEDQPLAYYEFMVCDTPENAQTVITMYAAFGTALVPVEEDPCVIFATSDGDTFGAMLIALQASGLLTDTTASAYVDYYKTYNGGTVIE